MLRSEICSRENCRAVREAAGGRDAREGAWVFDRQGLQGDEAVANGVVSKAEIAHGAGSCGDRDAERARGSQASLGLLEALYDRLRLDGQAINHKRLHRVYCAMKLNLPRRTKRRLPTRIRQPLEAPQGLNQIWALDFMADSLYSGRAYRTLNIIDEGNRQVLGIEVAYSIPSLRVIRVLQQLIEMYGKPRALRLDNGPELTSVAFTEWCAENGIEVRFIQPGKPDQYGLSPFMCSRRAIPGDFQPPRPLCSA